MSWIGSLLTLVSLGSIVAMAKLWLDQRGLLPEILIEPEWSRGERGRLWLNLTVRNRSRDTLTIESIEAIAPPLPLILFEQQLVSFVGDKRPAPIAQQGAVIRLDQKLLPHSGGSFPAFEECFAVDYGEAGGCGTMTLIVRCRPTSSDSWFTRAVSLLSKKKVTIPLPVRADKMTRS